MQKEKSSTLFARGKQIMPGGVNSPVRAFNAVGGEPLFIKSAKGAKIIDVDGNEFIDYVSSWGPLIFGHAHPIIVEAITRQAELGTSYGASTELEIELAEKVVNAVPSIDAVRMVNSGTEAVMSALRLARGITGRDKIVKFEGCYHGHGDSLLVRAGSGLVSLGIPECPGIVPSLAEKTLNLPFNDIEAVRGLFQKEGNDIAALIVEPIAGNMGVIPPKAGFLEALREETKKADALLIFDEVITGFRVSLGGAQKLFGITPDITCMGKIIGGGLPVGAYGGSKEMMDYISPVGSIYQAGTLSGNPLAMAAGNVVLDLLSELGVYDLLEEKSKKLCEGLEKNTHELGLSAKFTRVGSMFSMFFTNDSIENFQSVKTCDTEFFKRYFNGLLDEGVYIAPSQFEAGFMTVIHSDKEIDQTIDASMKALKSAKSLK